MLPCHILTDVRSSTHNTIEERKGIDMNNKKTNNRSNTSGAFAAHTSLFAAKSSYEGSVGSRALSRAGRCKNLKGHAFEIMTCDKINANPLNRLRGKTAHLTKSPIATRDDIVVMQGGKVMQRFQLKDTPSALGARDTFNRMASGQYSRTSGVITTKETTKAVTKLAEKSGKQGGKVLGKLRTSRISSKETELIAAKTLGGNPAKYAPTAASHVGKAGLAGGAISGTIAGFRSVKKWHSGEWTGKQAIGYTAKETVIGAAAGSAADAVGTSVTIAVAATPAAPIAVPAGIAAGAATAYVVDKTSRTVESRIQSTANQKAKAGA